MSPSIMQYNSHIVNKLLSKNLYEVTIVENHPFIYVKPSKYKRMIYTTDDKTIN